MATLSENINQAISDFDDIKSAIIERGVAVPDSIPTSEYGNMIRGIEGGGSVSISNGWRPHPDWWDVKAMVDTGIVPWQDDPLQNIRYGFVVSDNNRKITLTAGYIYALSDGTVYNATTNITHEWNVSLDKSCSDGYKTRAVMVISTNRDVEIIHTGFEILIDSLYVYCGDCNIINLTFGDPSIPNRIIQSFEINEKTTASEWGISPRAFYQCTALSKAEIPYGETSVAFNVFGMCAMLTEVNLPSSINSFGTGAFEGCTALQDIALTDSVASIGMGVFIGCTALSNVTISSSVNYIDEYAFYNCSGIKAFNIPIGFDLSLNLSTSYFLSLSSIDNLANNYADMTGKTSPTLTLSEIVFARVSADTLSKLSAKNITVISA